MPFAFVGSSKLQWSVLAAPGNTGQVWRAVSQTVMTQFQGWPRNSSIPLALWPLMSTPASAITATASGLTWVGSIPALAAS